PRTPRRVHRTSHRSGRRRDRADAAHDRPRFAGVDDRRHRSRLDQVRHAAGVAGGDHRRGSAGQDSRDCRQERGVPQLHRPRLLRHPHAERHPAQHPGEPRLVHRVHPYQAEISQGRMEALINFQTMCADLTGMEIANASLLDEATAAAEAMTLAKRSCKSKSNVFFVSNGVHPQTLEVVRTRAEPLGIELVGGADSDAAGTDAFGVLLQYPDTFGSINDYRAIADAVHARGGLVAVATDLLALTLIAAPGEWGADIVVGNSQRFGVPFGFGGPHAAFMACRDTYKRSMPGRLIGVSIDSEGKAAYRLTLQTREQHIRREK